MDLHGRTVIITGATGALGVAVVRAFRRVGADVVGVVRSEPDAPEPGVRYEVVDLTSEGAVAQLFAGVPEPWAVINTVGGFAPHRPLAQSDPEEIRGQLELNLITAAILTTHALRAMQPAGEGRIVHTASRSATHPAGSGFAYSVAKAGVLHLVRMAAEEVAATRIRVNAVSPSIINTPTNRVAMPNADHDAWPTPEQIAQNYLFLAAPATELLNGADLPV